jgi:MGT family glycosyltransferase
MSTILIYTSPARGHLYPMMDVALGMRAAGHRVVVQTLADERAAVEATGLEHRAIDPRIEALPLLDFEGTNPLDQMRRTMARWVERAPIEVDDLRRTRAEVAADLVVVDANTLGAGAAAEADGGPWAMFLPYCLPVPSRDAPAFGPGLAPPRGWMGRLRDRLLWFVQAQAARGPMAPLAELRARLGVAPLGTFSDVFVRPPILLYRTAEPFEYPRSDWPANVRAIGPGLWAPPGDAPEWLSDLPHPRVLVSVSTELQEDGAIIEAALAALSDQPGSVIVTTAALDPARFVPPNERVRVCRYLPHAAIVPHVDLVITHGGMGMTQRALAAGVPLCVVPWGRDQLESGRRVEVAEAGVVVPRGRLDAARLRDGVRAALGKKDGAERVARGFAAAGGAARAVQILEERLAAG